ncbi:MAG: DUF1549 domain-containing protein [Proteobacteria bacterium]|nr:DUF1549 domain-containing protein [Pseudomonadota bacterium]
MLVIQRMISRFFRAVGVGSVLAAVGAAGAPAAGEAEGVAFFEQKIRPVLVSACYECHSVPAKAKGKLKGALFLDTRAALLTGGDEGPAIVPGKADDSLLIKAIRWSREDLHMPPKKKLPPEVIADFEKWIAMGAPDPRTGEVAKARREINVTQSRDYWAFRPLKPVTVPAVKNAAWAKTPIDRFILAGMEKAGVTPSQPVSSEQLLRRVTFDLVGLPPTVEQLERFARDLSPSPIPTGLPKKEGGNEGQRDSGMTALVNQLLASPAYGERWGRHWLDVVRYAESGGYEFDGFRPGAYHYRDWVIRAFNDGMPYDRFIRWQLAGDKLKPDTLEGASATGFLVAGPYPGQITAKTIERIRYDQLDDMVSTIGSGFLGLTLGCVRCHEHKYDPIPQADYYGLAAALARTAQGDIKIDRVFEETQKQLAVHKNAAEPLEAALKQFETAEFPARFAKWRESAPAQSTNVAPWQMCDVNSASATSAALVIAPDGTVRYSANKAKDDTYTVKVATYQRGLRALRLDALADDSLPAKGPGLSDNGNFVLADVKVTARPLDAKSKEKPVTLKLKAVAATHEQKNYPLTGAVDAKGNSGWAVAPEFGKDHAAIFGIVGEPVGFEGGTELEFQLVFKGFFGLGKFRLGFSTNESPALAGAKEEQSLRELHSALAATGGELNATNRALLFRWYARFDPEAVRLQTAVREHAAKTPKPQLVDVYTTKAGGQDVFLLRRGEVDSKVNKAAPDYLQVLNTASEGTKRWLPKPDADPRIALGDWLTDAEHGAGSLLARVMVNRVWQHHFGRGLVATPNDFGVQGKPPTHPELLDWLANEFIRSGWQLKPLHQLIMASAVYQQGADLKPANLKADPENKLWWHRPARRLEAEAIRDALLSVGGRLDDKLYGPSETNYESPRRSVYLRVKRSELIPFLTLFDAPEPAASVGERGATTLPTQALASYVLSLARSSYLHCPFDGRKATAGNLAFPFSPSDFEGGDVYDFSVYHLMKVKDQNALFPVELETI